MLRIPSMRKQLIVFLLLFSVVFFLNQKEVWAFKVHIHEDITNEALIGSVGFDVGCSDEVADSNYYTDVFEFYVLGAHVDDNLLDEGSERLGNKKESILESLKACKRRDALDALGEALHTVQDVYAHSNSVDNNINIPNLLGMAKGTAHCDPNNGFAPGGLVSGYFNMVHFLYPCKFHLLPPFPNRPAYQRCLEEHNECTDVKEGNCCHRELNKDDAHQLNGGNYPRARFAAKNATLTYWNLIETDINAQPDQVADQFLKMLKKKQRNVFFVLDDTGSMGNDLDKMKTEVHKFLDNLIAGEEAPTIKLLTFKDSVTERGSFCGDDLDAFRNEIQFLTASGGGDCPEASNRALLKAIRSLESGRNDIKLRGCDIILSTDASTQESTLGPTIRQRALNAGIRIHSIITGDCASSSYSATRLAGLAEFSDNDSANKNQVMIQAYEKQSELESEGSSLQVRSLSGTDDPLISPSSRIQLPALADQTGGISFNVTRSEVDDVTSILFEFGAPDTEVFFSQKVALSSGGTTVVEIPVDDTLSTRVSFMVTGAVRYSRPSVTINRPNGTVVDSNEAGVTLTQLSSVVNYAIDNPEVGIWRVELTGNGNFLVRAFGQTAMQVNGLRLLQETLQPPRPGLDFIPIEGDMVMGAEIVAEIRLTMAPGNVSSLTLQRPDGTVILTPAVTSRDGVRRFQATFNVPSEPFLIKLIGQTLEGNAFHREIPTVLVPQTVGINVAPISADAAPESTAQFSVTVTNASESPATYVLSGSSSLDWTVNSPSEPLVVQPGEFQTVIVEVEVPMSAELGTTTAITISVQDVNISTTRNSTSVSLRVEGDNDSDDDGIPDNEDECEESNLENTIIIDECDSNVENTLFANGCSISDLVGNCAQGSKNHGQFVSCVSKLTNDLKKDGVLSGQQKGMIQNCAAKANLP